MWFEDLSKCNYFGKQYAEILTPIGWLENGKTFTVGKTPKNIYSKLCEFNKKPWQFPVISLGFHDCDLCEFQFESEHQSARGVSNIFIPHNGKIYVCPELITHYVNSHFYLPPKEFLEAVDFCPPQGSMEYLRKMLENGGRYLVKTIKEK